MTVKGRGLDPRFMQELKFKNNIVEVIGSYTSLDRKGNTHWACCPFHHEKTASFAVNESEQFYHCFGCGVSGDVVKFVQEIESTDFMGAVRILAARVKMTVPESDIDTEQVALAKKKRDQMSAIMLDSAKFYLSNLYSGDKRADEHLQYISNRKLAPTTVKKFGLGASLDFFSLPDYLAGKGYSRENLLDTGVLTETKNGKLVDSQGGRLIFPIINAMDEVVAFGGRLLEKSDFAKYKNTKETLLFNKSKTLYNINLLKKLKREQPINDVIFVEGYMDTISLYQAGFRNVVASMGTALTKEQARLVKRYSDNVLISYDGDFAGQKNTLRGLEILKAEGLSVRVVPLPEGADPDDVVKQGKEAYQKCLDEALPLIDYKLLSLEKKFDLSRVEEKRKFVSEALKVVATADSESVKEELLKRLREKTKISYQALERDLSAVKKDDKDDVLDTPIRVEIRETSGESSVTDKASRFVLAAKLFSLPYAKDFDLSEIEFTSSVHKVIAEYVIEKERANDRVRPSELFEFLDENCPEFNEILDLNYEDKLAGEVGEKFFLDSVKTLEKQDLERKMDRLQKACSEETDLKKRNEMLKELSALLAKKNKLK